MKTYTISYDLLKPGQDYNALIERLRQHGAIRIMYSGWALRTSWTAAQLRDDLKAYIDTNDRLLVTEVGQWASYNLLAVDKFKEIAA